MRTGFLSAMALVIVLHAAPGLAQPFPAKSIRFIVPFAAGGSSDTLARTLGQALTDALGQQAVVDLVGGHIQVMFSAFSSTLPHIKAGRLRPLAVTGSKRSSPVPDVPTVAESGFPRFEAVTWYSIVAPAGTPPAVVGKLNDEILRSLALVHVKERLGVLGFEIVGSPPDVLAAYIKSEILKWAPVVKASGAKID